MTLAWGLLAALTLPAGAGEPVPLWPAEGPVAPAREPQQEARRAAALAALYGTEPRTVGSLRGLGLGWVDVECAVAVSTRAGRPLVEVLDLRAAGMEWGDIAKSFGFMLGDAVRDAGLRDAPAEPAPGRRKASARPPARKKRSAPPDPGRSPR